MFETEVHLHHVTRLTILLRERLSERHIAEQIAKLRVTAGLPGESNGMPLPKPR
jgi:hypothetical protein